ncbi:MAG: DUF6427 family protein [Flavobacteriales bacterium]
MIVKIFKTNQIIANIFIVLLSVLLWIPGYYNHVELNFENHSLFNLFGKWFVEHRWINVLFTSFLIGFQAVFLNFIINQEKLIKGNTHLVGLFYVVLNGALALLFTINPIIIVNTFLITILFLMFKLYSQSEAKALLFNTCFLLSIGTLFYMPLFCLLPLIWIVLSYVRTPGYRDYFISLIGFLLPFLYLTTYLYITDGLYKSNIIDWIYYLSIFPKLLLNQPYFYYISVLTGFVILSGASLVSQLSREVVKDRKLFIVLILMTIFIASTVLFNTSDYISLYILLTIPFSVVLANYFYKLKKEWLAEVFFILLVLGILASYFL